MVVGAASVQSGGEVLLASRLGQLKKLGVDSLRLCQRGDLGQIGVRFLERGDALVDLQEDNATVLGVVLGEGRSLRLLSAGLPQEDSCGCGEQLPLKTGDSVTKLVPLQRVC